MEQTVEIRNSTESDRPEIANIHIQAFGREKGLEIADLVENLFDDKTAMPILSLVAVMDGKLIGHILYTKVYITQTAASVSARILAPLAVLPDAHSRGVGCTLINESLKQLKSAGVELAFVLGHPDYYPRCGFAPAGKLGFEAPYPIPAEHADAWMVQELNGEVIGKVTGKVQCADVLDQPQHWRE